MLKDLLSKETLQPVVRKNKLHTLETGRTYYS